MGEADLAGGTLYPILARLEGRGWLRSEWEEDVAEGRPARRYYVLTDEGLHGAERELAAAEERTRARLARFGGRAADSGDGDMTPSREALTDWAESRIPRSTRDRYCGPDPR